MKILLEMNKQIRFRKIILEIKYYIFSGKKIIDPEKNLKKLTVINIKFFKMKLCYCILSLIFQFSLYSQNDTIAIDKPSNISVVSADKMNVVYRGVPNPISIAVPNAKSFVVSGNGLTFVKGKYLLSAGLGKETKIIVEIENFDGYRLTEEHIFRIKGLP